MTSAIAPCARPNLASSLVLGPTVRAVAPTAVAPALRERPQRAPGQHIPSAVALAPAAMSALVEAQERLAQDAPILVRQHTAEKLDQLIVRLDDASGTAGNGDLDAPFAVRRLQAAREALSPGRIDLQA